MKKNIPKYQTSINEFRAELKKQNKPYLILNELPANKVQVQFEGKMQGENVVWNACFQTIEAYAKTHAVAEDPKQFIKIEIENKVYKIQVALNLKQFDQAAVERTIIMVRKYKRLQLGKHEYGARSKTE